MPITRSAIVFVTILARTRTKPSHARKERANKVSKGPRKLSSFFVPVCVSIFFSSCDFSIPPERGDKQRIFPFAQYFANSPSNRYRKANVTLRLVQSSERGPFEWANFASFATVTGGAKKRRKEGETGLMPP